MFIILTLLYSMLLVVMLNYVYKYEGSFSTIYVFGVSSFIYFLIIPLELFFSGQSYLVVNSIISEFSGSNLVSIAILAIFSLIGFYTALRITNFFLVTMLRQESLSPYNKRVSVRIERGILIMVLACVVILGIFYHGTILDSIKGYHYSYTIRYASPLFSYLATLVSLGLSVFGVINFRKLNFIGVLIGLVCLFVVFGIGTIFYYKVLILPMICGLASCFFSWKKIKPFYLLIMTMALIPILLFFLTLFTLYRTPVDIDSFKVRLKQTSFTRSDPSGAMVSIFHALNSPEPFLLGSTYAQVPVIFIPKIFYPNRPLDLSEKFAREVISDWQPGQGLSFSPLAEAYMNFGYCGPLLQYFIFGLIWAGIWSAIRRYFFNEHFELYSSFYYVIGFFTLIQSFRTPFGLMPKMLIMNVTPFLLVLLIAIKIKFEVRNLEPRV